MTTLCEKKISFITPAFLSGGDQNMPEIRVPSIRGALRWWFRVLGGTRDQERSVFGGVHGDVTASRLVVRVSEMSLVSSTTISFSPMSDKGYLYYFASVSGNKEGIHRTEQGHYVAEKSECKIVFMLRGELAAETLSLLNQAIDAFLLLGALGLRATRGCGCFTVGEPISQEELVQKVAALPKGLLVRVIDKERRTSARECQSALGGYLRALRKDNNLSSSEESALGFSRGQSREASALKLRPLQVKEGYLPVVVYSDAACTQTSLWDIVRSSTKEI